MGYVVLATLLEVFCDIQNMCDIHQKNNTCEQPTILHGFKIPLHNKIQLNKTKTWNNIIYHNTIPNRI